MLAAGFPELGWGGSSGLGRPSSSPSSPREEAVRIKIGQKGLWEVSNPASCYGRVSSEVRAGCSGLYPV